MLPSEANRWNYEASIKLGDGMNDTSSFFLFTLTTTLAVSVIVVWNRSVVNSGRMARGFCILCLVLGLAAFITTIFVVSGLLPVKGAFGLLFRLLIYRGWIVIGTGVSSALLMVSNALVHFRSRVTSEAVRSFVGSPYLLKGLCLSVSISFVATEIGKFTHDAEMRQFFFESGYPIWFLYFTAGAEILGAIGLFVRQTIVPAASGLAIVMLGAIGTHYRNNDSFSDSLEALHLLILLACIVLICWIGRRVPQGTGLMR
jgi:uncharacterized membrane protein